MSGRRRHLKVIDRGDTFILRGWKASELAKEAGVKTCFNGVSGGWVGDGKRLPDLLAYLQYRNITVSLVPVGGDTRELA